ncbi:PIR protein [Plasmodium vivax]|uniref:VIR protein n=1 Tax=Plasmodium vivax TaxID=5855 RepID=A0A565A405_PLAVI|nr:PIR protein [Plasmodium vivax]
MEPPVEDEKYDFADIFPTCKYYFDRETKNLNGEYMHNCISISRQLHNDVNREFLQPCQKLIQYLKYIKKESSTGNHIQSCKYFSYILKNELRSFNNTCNGTKECYNKIHKTYEETSHGIDVCKDHIEEINETIFKKFQNLDSLYDIFYKFTSTQGEEDNGKCALGKTCSEQYYTLINICDQNSNIGFCKALDKFKDTYNMHMKDGSQCDKVPRYLYSPFGTEKRRTFSISLITIFAMSTILFTVYKFTPAYSWLHSILRRKNNIQNDLYEESRDLKNNADIKKFNSRNIPLNIQYHSSENS